MMLEWSPQSRERRLLRARQLISSSCRRTRTKSAACRTWSLRCSRCIQQKWPSRAMKPTTLSPSRGRILCEPGDDYRSDTIQRQEEGNETSFVRPFVQDGALLEGQGGIERWESYVSRYEKKLKSKLDDEIQLAGLRRWCRVSWRNT